ncbi:DUF2381 family protein [Hyalangium versicolor]|uniref:DUF2381 family protein n=1 Tax=Hyalangium versicolor TaxID=2861190 RepID=UPI001CCF0298|nr:DUF2381 family protein [Hyalangium versicolor]
MIRPLCSHLAFSALLVGLAATAQTATSVPSSPRSVEFTGKVGESPLLYLAPGTLTLITLDAPIVRESVELEDRPRFAVVEVGTRTITLSPAAPLGPGEQLTLRVTYREGSPRSVVFRLTGQPGTVDDVVNVSRPQQTVEACRVELSATLERYETQRRELEELKAHPPAVSPAAVALAGWVDAQGLLAMVFQNECHEIHGELRPVKCKGLGASTWSVVVLEVLNAGPEPWEPAWAEVTPVAGGDTRRARTVLSGHALISSGESVPVAIEIEMPTRELKQWLTAPHTLRVCNAEGTRCLSLSLVNL